MIFTVDLSQLAGLRETIEKFGDDVREHVAIEGAAGMAKVIYDEARLRAPVSVRPHYFYGTEFRKRGIRYLIQPGTLRDSIYRVYAYNHSNPNYKLYKVSWNHTKAPHGAMVEFGTSRALAHPFMRPSIARIGDAMEAGNARMAAKLLEITGAS